MSSFFNMDSPVMRFLSRLCDLMILNILCLICCIPIVTIGASITALYSVTLKMVKGEDSYIAKGFFKGFRQNFKISTIIWLILLVIGALLAFDFRAVNMLPAALQNVFRILVGAFITFYILLFSYIFPYIARFENGIKDTIKKFSFNQYLKPSTYSFNRTFTNRSGCLYILNQMTTLAYGSLLWFLMGVSFVAYVNSISFRIVFAKYEPSEDEEEPSFESEEVNETANEEK